MADTLAAPPPTCCPDASLCLVSREIECPRHGGLTACCDRPEAHVPQDRATWHRQMERWERSLLDRHVRQRMLRATLTPPPDPATPAALSAAL